MKKEAADQLGVVPPAHQVDKSESWKNYREWVATMMNTWLAPDGMVATDQAIDDFAQLLDCRARELASCAPRPAGGVTGEDFWMDELEFQLGRPLTPKGRDCLRSWLRAFAAHVKRQPDPARPAGGWHPIETAPKDGTHVLIAIPTTEYGVWVDAAWWKDDEWRSIGCDRTDSEPAFLPPSHWMPLPAPPSLGVPPPSPEMTGCAAKYRRDCEDAASLGSADAKAECERQGWWPTPPPSETEKT